MRKLSELYGQRPSGQGLKSEGRGFYDEWAGSIQPPSFLVSDLLVTFLGYYDKLDPYLGFVKTRKFKFDVKTFIDVTNRLTEEPQRLGTIAFWKDSYTEQLRKSLRITKYISRTVIFERLKVIAKDNNDIFLRCLILYYKAVLERGDFSFEQFTKDLTDKKDSSSAFKDIDPFLKKNRDVLSSPDIKRLYVQEVKETKEQLAWLIDHLEKVRKGEFNFELIDPNFTINALRCKPPKLNFETVTSNLLSGTFEVYRARCAGGVIRISRLSWPIFHTKIKELVMIEISDVLSKAFSIKLHTLEGEKLKFYIQAGENSINCYDIINAEKTWGVIFEGLLPGIIDFSLNDKFPDQYAAALQSGIDITRLINTFGIMCLIKYLEDEGLISKNLDIWSGGDNFGFKTILEKPVMNDQETEDSYLDRLVTADNGLWHILDNDTRILGYNPKLKRVGGLHFSIDGVDSMVSWKPNNDSFRWTQSKQRQNRVIDGLVQLDLYEQGTCDKMYRFLDSKNSDLDFSEIYNHDDIWNRFAELINPAISDLFPGMVEWAKIAFNINDDFAYGKYVQDSDANLYWIKSKSIFG